MFGLTWPVLQPPLIWPTTADLIEWPKRQSALIPPVYPEADPGEPTLEYWTMSDGTPVTTSAGEEIEL